MKFGRAPATQISRIALVSVNLSPAGGAAARTSEPAQINAARIALATYRNRANSYLRLHSANRIIARGPQLL